MTHKTVETLGIMTLLMLQSKQHQAYSIADLHQLCLAPLDAGLVACATTGANDKMPGTPLAFATFARVSDDWDAKLRDADFDLVKMPKDAWTSGTHQWLVDLVATKDMANEFAMRAAAQVFEAGSMLNIRLRGEDGKIQNTERKIAG